MRTLRRVLLVVLIATATGFILPLFGTTALPPDCEKTTLEGQLVLNSGGVLVCTTGQGIVLRQDLGTALSGRESRRKTMKTFFTVADFQLADEESPARGEWADGCEAAGIPGAYRPHEALIPHMMNAHVRAANRIAKTGGPVLKQPFNFAVALGDLADNQQRNETRWFIDILDGQKLLNPDSGEVETPPVDLNDDYPGPDDYDGVMDIPPETGTPLLTVPPEAQFPTQTHPVTGKPNPMPPTLNNLANEPFWVEGFRKPDGSPLPWYTALGNHDAKVQGSIPDDNPGWRALVRQYAMGHSKLPATSTEAAVFCSNPTPQNFANLVSGQIGGTTVAVPKDSRRIMIDKIDWIKEHDTTTGLPDGHGFLPSGANWCPAGDPPAGLALEEDAKNRHRRGCYSWIEGIFQFITLDTNPQEGLESGNIDNSQFVWLEELLTKSSKKYFDTNGDVVDNSNGRDRLIVIFAHHPLSSQDNPGHPFDGGPPAGTFHTGAELKALLLRYPNVVLLADGHSHQNRIWPHENASMGTGFWEVNTSAIADLPTHSRTIEIADNRDGTISIFSVVFDARGAADPREIHWINDDPSNEMSLAGAGKINEEWLASAGREIMFNDPQQEDAALGDPVDRNVELIIKKPFSICRASGCDPR